MRPLVTEAIGTFFLVLTYGVTVNHDAALAGLSIGMILMVMVYAGGPISGAHYNPAVSLGMVVAGKLPARQLVPYWVAQFAGAMLATLVVWKMSGVPTHVEPDELASVSKVFVAELLATFALAYVVLHVAAGKGREGNAYYGLAIGATIASLAVSIGPITGGAFNPALGTGSAIVELALGSEPTSMVWLYYLVAPFLGATLAAFVFRYQEGENPR